jgi:hypothetical protein
MLDWKPSHQVGHGMCTCICRYDFASEHIYCTNRLRPCWSCCSPCCQLLELKSGYVAYVYMLHLATAGACTASCSVLRCCIRLSLFLVDRGTRVKQHSLHCCAVLCSFGGRRAQPACRLHCSGCSLPLPAVKQCFKPVSVTCKLHVHGLFVARPL